MSDEKTNDESYIPETHVYIGKCLLTGGKTGRLFQRENNDGTLAEETTAWSFRKTRHFGVGGRYLVLVQRGETIMAKWEKCRYLGMYSDKDSVAEWQTAARIYDIQQRVKREERTETAENLIKNALEPVRKLYRRTDRVGQLAIEVQVLSYLRFGEKAKAVF